MNLSNHISPVHLISMILTLALIMFLGVASGRRVRSNDDFQTGGRSAGTLLVTGGLISSLVGGSSTIGSAELSFNWGISAWWFTIGSSLGAIILGLVYSRRVREHRCTTLQEIVAAEYGATAGLVTSVLTSIGFLINVVSQLLAAQALICSFLGLSHVWAILLAALIMTSYVIFGGMKSSGVLGLVKLLLLYTATLGGGLLALHLSGGWGQLTQSLDHQTYFNFFSRGVGNGLSSCFSVCLGVIASQNYIQVIFSGKDNRSAARGAFISGLLALPIGLLSIFIGMYMKLHYSGIEPGQSFPLFILSEMPPVLAGIIMAGLLIVIVSAGAGMSFGFSTVVTTDIYKRFLDKKATDRRCLLVERLIILAVMVFGCTLTIINQDSPILNWGFLSLALRAVVMILPMTAALFMPGKIPPLWATLSSVLGLAAMGLGKLLGWAMEPLYLGLLASFCSIVIGWIAHRLQTKPTQR